MKRVVITGLGCVTPIGNSVPAFGEALLAGRSGIAPFSPDFPGALGPGTGLRFTQTAMVRDFDPVAHLTSGVIAATDPGGQFAIVAARQAEQESGLTGHYDPSQIAVIVGCGCGGRSADENANRHLYTRNARVSPMAIVQTMASGGASQISIDLSIGGPVLSLATACASGTHAIGVAFHMVRSGAAPAAITGGYEAALTFGFLRAWDSMRVVSPTTCRPFSADRDGMTLGEGSAMLAIEPLDDALARDATIYAEIVGFGMSADAQHMTQPKPEGAAQAILRALADAQHADLDHAQGGNLAARVCYLNAHGTGTRLNDAIEAQAIHLALGPHAPRIPISATKSLTGHSIGATGAIEALATAWSLHMGTLPFTAGVREADPTLDLDIIVGEPRTLPRSTPGAPDLALSTSLAFGGLNAVLALRRYPGAV